MKAFIAFVVLLFLLLGVGLGVYGWGRWTRIDPRGSALTIEQEIPAAEVERLTKRYNEILDREEVLLPTIQKHNLKSYYKVGSDQEALILFRKDSSVELPGGQALHVLFTGKRSTRKEREAASRTLAEDFVQAARVLGGN